MTVVTLQVEYSNGETRKYRIPKPKRGLEKEIILPRREISHIDLTPLATYRDLVKLDLIGNEIEDIDLSPLGSCTSLQSLYLKDNHLDTIDLSSLASCPDLRELSVTGNSLREVDLRPLRTCTQLELLGLGANRLKSVDLEPLRSFGELDVLYLYDNRFKTIDLDPLRYCTRFKELQLYQNDLTEIDLTPLSACVNLNWLDLSVNQLSTIDLTPLNSCTRLSKLNLSSNVLDSIDLHPLSACAGFRELALNNNKLSTLDLSPLVMCTELSRLYLQSNRFRRLDLTSLGLADGLSGNSWETHFFVDSHVPWIETLFSENRFWSVYSEKKLSIRYDAPSFIPDLTVICRILSKVITGEPEWKTMHLLHNMLSLLGLEWLGMVDTDAASLLTEFLTGQKELNQKGLLERVISLVSAQIDSGSTTIGLDIDRMAEYPELAIKFDRVADQRRKELAQVEVIENDSGLDLRPLWLTAHGYQILSALGLGTGCGTNEAVSVQHALSELGFELLTTRSGIANYVTELSQPLREYIWHFANYRSELRRLALEE